MKTIAVWSLMAVVMIASQPSYAFGDLLFHGLLMKTMEDDKMLDVAPPEPTAAMPWDGNDVTLPLDIDKRRCSAETYIAAAEAKLTGEQLTTLDKYCRGQADKNPMISVSAGASMMAFGVSTMTTVPPCTGSSTVAIDTFEGRDPEALADALNRQDQDCDDPRIIHRVHVQ